MLLIYSKLQPKPLAISKLHLEFLTENKLPERLRKDFPPEFYGQPIEEIDDFHKTENVSFKFFILFLKTHNFLI